MNIIETSRSSRGVRIDTGKLDSGPSLTSAQIDKVPKPRKYINHNIAGKVLKIYQTSVLLGEKLIYNGVNVLDSAYSDMKKMEKSEMAKSLLNIRVINFHNFDCM